MPRTTFASALSMARENKTLTLCLLVISAAILVGSLAANPALAASTFNVNRTTNTSEFTGEPRSVRPAP